MTKYLFFGLAFLVCANASAKIVYYTEGDIVQITMAISHEEKSLASVICLADEPAISNIITAFNKEDISMETKGNKIFLKLLRKMEGHLDLIGGSATLYRIYIVTSENDHYDSYVELKLKKRGSEASAIDHSPALDMIKDMRLLRNTKSYSVKKVKTKDTLHKTKSFRIALLYVYEDDDFTGYICSIENYSEDSLEVDLSRFYADNLVLIASKDVVVKPKSMTYLYFVFAR